MALTTSTDSSIGGQANTQSPQTATAPATSGSGPAARGGSVQPGTATNLLTSQNGISLSSGGLSTVQLGQDSGSQTATVQRPAEPKPAHHFNGVLLGFSAALFVIAILVFWIMRRSAKNTTE